MKISERTSSPPEAPLDYFPQGSLQQDDKLPTYNILAIKSANIGLANV